MDDRTRYIGGSDCAGVLGLSRYRTPLQVWAEKTGVIIPENIDEKLQVELGRELEDFVARRFTKETGLEVRRVNETLYHPEYPFIGANIDRRIVGTDAFFEAKTTSAYRAKDWEGEEFPPESLLQCYHYQMVLSAIKGRPADGWLAVLIGSHDFQVKKIKYDAKIIGDILKREVAFWNDYVLPNIMPLVKAEDTDVLNTLFPHARQGEVIQLGDDVDQICESIEALSQDKFVVEKEVLKLRNQLKVMIKENEIGRTSLYEIRWSDVRKEAYTVAASDFRVLRYRKIKQEEGQKND